MKEFPGEKVIANYNINTTVEAQRIVACSILSDTY